MITRHISRFTPFTMLLAGFLVLAGCGSEAPKDTATPAPAAAPAAPATGPATMAFQLDKEPAVGGKESTVHVALQDASGKAISDAQVHMTLTMPAMPEMKMPEMKNDADLKWTGSDYSGSVQIMMKGGWDVVVEAKRGSEVLATHKTHLDAK